MCVCVLKILNILNKIKKKKKKNFPYLACCEIELFSKKKKKISGKQSLK